MGHVLPLLGIGAAKTAPVVASGAAFPSAAGVPLLGAAKVAPTAGAGGLSGALKASLPYLAAAAPSAASVFNRPKSPGLGKRRPGYDREAAEAADRERARRAREGQRQTILSGPAGAPGSALLGRTILSGG